MYSTFYKPKSEKGLKEERILIDVLWKQHRQGIIEDLLIPGESVPTDEEIKVVFDLFIEELRKEGKLKEILDKYLQIKVKNAMSNF